MTARGKGPRYDPHHDKKKATPPDPTPVETSKPRYSAKRPAPIPRHFKKRSHHCKKLRRWTPLTPLAMNDSKILVYSCRRCDHRLVTTLDPQDARALTEPKDSWVKYVAAERWR